MSATDLDNFQRGFVFWESPKPEFAPPADPDDLQVLREWLDGFQQAHADYPETVDFEDGMTVIEALNEMLAEHPALPTLQAMLRPH